MLFTAPWPFLAGFLPSERLRVARSATATAFLLLLPPRRGPKNTFLRSMRITRAALLSPVVYWPFALLRPEKRERGTLQKRALRFFPSSVGALLFARAYTHAASIQLPRGFCRLCAMYVCEIGRVFNIFFFF